MKREGWKCPHFRRIRPIKLPHFMSNSIVVVMLTGIAMSRHFQGEVRQAYKKRKALGSKV